MALPSRCKVGIKCDKEWIINRGITTTSIPAEFVVCIDGDASKPVSGLQLDVSSHIIKAIDGKTHPLRDVKLISENKPVKHHFNQLKYGKLEITARYHDPATNTTNTTTHEIMIKKRKKGDGDKEEKGKGKGNKNKVGEDDEQNVKKRKAPPKDDKKGKKKKSDDDDDENEKKKKKKDKEEKAQKKEAGSGKGKKDLPKDVLDWTVKHVSQWLKQKGFGDYINEFKENEIDGATLLNLPDESFEKLGLDNPIKVAKVKGLIEKLKKKQNKEK